MTIISFAYKLADEVIFMNYKDYQQARDAAWRILIDCGVRELPVNLNVICAHLGIRVFSYSAGKSVINRHRLGSLTMKTDGFLLYLYEKPIVFFDEHCSPQRIRFTIAHEIGHLILDHIRAGQVTTINREPAPGDSPQETAANQFAARLLAPACVLWGMDVHTTDDIAQLCNISHVAAAFRAERMRILYARQKFLTSPLERKVYDQFKGFMGV